MGQEKEPFRFISQQRKLRLLELGCGKAGDLQKMIENGFTTVVGIDNVVTCGFDACSTLGP